MTVSDTQTSAFAITTWIAPNPFSEPSAFALLHPTSLAEVASLTEKIQSLGLQRLDSAGDILPIGTDTLYASLRATRVEFCTPTGVWCEQSVTDEWMSAAIARRYVVFAVGTEVLSLNASPEEISEYIRQHESVYTALVKIRVRFEQG